MAAVYDRAAIEAQVKRIREEVQRDGGAYVSCEDLRILCPDEFTVAEQFMHIATIARREGWSFAFLPDGRVHFGAYAKA